MFIIIFSIVIQFFTAAYAVRLIKKTGGLFSWICVSTALVLMGVRRILTLYFYSQDSDYAVKTGFELTGLVLSIIMMLGVIGLGRIIMERKKNQEKIQILLQQKELLLKEVHHRIKNNMNTISSLLELQGAEAEDDVSREALKTASSRVRSMFHLYNRIYKSDNFQKAYTGEYFPSLVRDIVDNVHSGRNSISVSMDIDDFELEIQKLYYFGIIINELITNSIKYAFSDVSEPELFIGIKKKEDKVVITVRDNGSGISADEVKGSKGFGIRLIHNLTKELGAELLFSGGSGTEIVITAPA